MREILSRESQRVVIPRHVEISREPRILLGLGKIAFVVDQRKSHRKTSSKANSRFTEPKVNLQNLLRNLETSDSEATHIMVSIYYGVKD